MPREKKRTSKSAYALPKPSLDELLASHSQANRVTVEFLKVDVATALTFAGIALTTDNPVTKDRNRRTARRAYDTIVHFLKKTQLTDSDARELNAHLRQLKSELRQLGETV